MKLKKVYSETDRLAPFALFEEYCTRFSRHDNSGIIADCGEEIKSIVFALDLSKKAVQTAEDLGANCIITHHPAIFYPISSLSETQNGSLLACIRAGISVISAHLNLDTAKGGIDEELMHGLGGERAESLMEELSCGGYGRLFEVQKTALETFAARAAEVFHSKRILVYGKRPVKRITSFCGAGFDESALAFAREKGADTIVSSEGKHHLVAAACETGLNVLLLTHYAAEFYGFTTFYKNMKERLDCPCSLFCDEDLL